MFDTVWERGKGLSPLYGCICCGLLGTVAIPAVPAGTLCGMEMHPAQRGLAELAS